MIGGLSLGGQDYYHGDLSMNHAESYIEKVSALITL